MSNDPLNDQTGPEVRPDTPKDTGTQPVAISQDSKNMALLLWIGTFFFGFIPGLILYLVKKDDAYLLEQSKESLNWAITATLAYVVAFILTFVVIGALLIPLIALAHLVFCIMGAVASSKGNNFRVPLTLRLVK